VRHDHPHGTRIEVSPEQLRHGARVLRDGSEELNRIGARVRGREVPALPERIAGRVAAAVAEVGAALGSSAPRFATYAQELRVRALWAEVADAKQHHRSLDERQTKELLALMKTGGLTRWATDSQARWAGRMLADRFRDAFEDPVKLVELAALLKANARDENFAGGFISRFGAKKFSEIPRVIQALVHAQELGAGVGPDGNQAREGTQVGDGSQVRRDIVAKLLAQDPSYRYAGDPVKDLLAPFAQALAVATYAGTLSRDRQREIARDPDQWAVANLVAGGGKYGKEFLLDVFQSDVVDRIVAENGGAPAQTEDSSLSIGGLPPDPKVLVLDALAGNHDAAAEAFTHELPKLELQRPDGSTATVTDPVQLLLEFGNYADEGHALGEASAAAVDGLHDDGRDARANEVTSRLIHEVIRGRDDLGGIRDGVATIVATHDVMQDLHHSAASGHASPDYDSDHDGIAGASNENGIRLSVTQVHDLLGDLSQGDASRERMMDGVQRYQDDVIREAAAPHASEGDHRRAGEITNFNRLLVESVNDAASATQPPPAGVPLPTDPVAPDPARPATPVVPRPETPSAPSEPVGSGDGDAPAAGADASSSPVSSEGPGLAYEDPGSGSDAAYDPAALAGVDLPAPAEPWQTWDGGDADEMRDRVEVAVVSGYYEHGDLGTQDGIRAEIRALPHEEGFEPKPFFNEAGHILSYDAMDADQRATFERWLESERVQGVVGGGLETVGELADAADPAAPLPASADVAAAPAEGEPPAPADEAAPALPPDEAAELRDRIRTALVSGYFEHGDLGGETEIREELVGLGYGEGFEATSFFTDDGHLLSYDAMSHDQQLTFQHWVESDRVQALLGDVLDAVAPPEPTPAPV
jgi:hypothetical protein